MPLPKPSKTVSRRIKKPKPLLFTASQAEQQNARKPNKPQKERRVRVICTDPDATDSSSDEEGMDVPFRTKLAHKRLVREICLPASLPVSFCNGQQEDTSMGTVFSASPCLALEKRKGFKVARKDGGSQGLYERTDEPSVDAWRTNEPSLDAWKDSSNASLVYPGAEEFAQFLSEFLGVQEEGCIPAWDEELDLLDDGEFDNALELEFDFEPATWINSVQALV